MVIATAWPTVRKTPLMLHIERATGMDIRDALLAELSAQPCDADAAVALGRIVGNALHESTVSIWISRLNIVEQAAVARSDR